MLALPKEYWYISALQKVLVGVGLPKEYWYMTALRAHRKFSPGDDPWIPVELIEVTLPLKAHESRGLQHKRKVMKVEKVKEIRSPNEKGGKGNETGI